MTKLPKDIEGIAADIVRTEYSKSDQPTGWLLSSAIAEALVKERESAAETIRFYKDGFVFHPKRSRTGVDLSEWKPTDALLEDCGERANAFLKALQAKGDA